jgi:hypothetical protein
MDVVSKCQLHVTLKNQLFLGYFRWNNHLICDICLLGCNMETINLLPSACALSERCRQRPLEIFDTLTLSLMTTQQTGVSHQSQQHQVG